MPRVPVIALIACLIAAASLSVGRAAAGVTTNERFSFTAATLTCSGEIITVEADVHLVGRVTEDASGGSHLGSTVTVFFSGESASGDRYIGPSAQTTQILIDSPTAANNHTETFHQNLIRLGEDGGLADDLRIRAVFHFTFNATGELVASKFDFTSECS
jgi:hypothetical protein